MDKQSIIIEVEKHFSQEQLNGAYIHNGTSITFKQFLETIFINFVKDGANIANLVDYINNKIVPNLKVAEISNVKVDIPSLRPILDDEIEVTLSNGKIVQIYESEMNKLQYIENFVKARVDYVNSIRISEREYIDVLDTLVGKIPFMDDEFMISVGPNKKTIEEFYITLLNNTYKPATIVDKIEICTFYGNLLEDKVLDSKMDGMDITVRKYIEDVLPSKMVNSTDIIIDGVSMSIVDAIKKIEEHQLSIIAIQEREEVERKENIYNRTSENPGLLSEISVALNNENSLEITAEIPIVTKGRLLDEEVSSMVLLPSDFLFESEDEYYKKNLNDLRHAIKMTNNLHDLEIKEKEFKTMAAEIFSKELSSYVRSQVIALEAFIEQKRNDIIKLESNKQDYTEVIQDQIEELRNQMRSVSSIDDFSILKGRITQLEVEIYDQGITDYSLIASLESFEREFRNARARYDFKMTEYDVEKNKAVSTLNDLFSDLRRKIDGIEELKSQRDMQNIAIAINVKKEQIEAALAEYTKNKLISEVESQRYTTQLNMLIDKTFEMENKGYGL